VAPRGAGGAPPTDQTSCALVPVEVDAGPRARGRSTTSTSTGGGERRGTGTSRVLFLFLCAECRPARVPTCLPEVPLARAFSRAPSRRGDTAVTTKLPDLGRRSRASPLRVGVALACGSRTTAFWTYLPTRRDSLRRSVYYSGSFVSGARIHPSSPHAALTWRRTGDRRRPPAGRFRFNRGGAAVVMHLHGARARTHARKL
jgi:hypothetical protein